MSDEIPDDMAGQVEEGDTEEAMDVMDDTEEDTEAGGQAVKAGGLSIAPVRLTSEVGEDGQKKVPGIKIIGLSSELKKAMTGEESKDGSVEEDEEDEEEDEDESEEEEDEDEEEEDEEEDEEEEVEEDEESSLDAVVVKTPKVTIRKVMQVTTPGTAGGKEDSTPRKMPVPGSASVSSTVKKRGRPSRADLALREKERQEALARGEPDPELKRKRRKPLKLNDADSEEDSREERKKRKREEREERRQNKKVKPRSEDTEDTDVEEKPKKKGRKKKILTKEEEAARDEERKAKYKAIREKQKEKLERRKAYLIRKREERKEKKAEEKKKHEEHLKRMAELRSQYLDDNASDLPEGLMDENSQNSNPMFVKNKKKWGDVSQTELAGGVYNPLAHVTSETLFEYKWPLEGRHSEHYFLQEQVTEFLGVKSFKRKYPDCPRRTINMEERDFLIEMKIVNETQADLGLTAIPSTYVLDIMCADFYDKYEEYLAVINERKERSSRNYNYSSGCGNIKIEEAVKAAAEFNKKFNEERKSQRGAYFDIQTFTCQYPKDNKGNMKVLKKPTPGNYPVAMIPGQFVDHYRSVFLFVKLETDFDLIIFTFRPYSSKELRLFPLNTVTSAPPAPGLTTRDLNLGSGGSGSDSASSSSESSSDSESDSESEADQKKCCKPKPAQPFKVELKPRKKVDEIKPFATCKHCGGMFQQMKIN